MKRLAKLMGMLAATALTLSVYGSAPILLKSGTILPEKDSSSSTQIKVTSQQLEKVADRGLYIIQHDGVITPDWRGQIEAAGAIIRGYIPENAYLIEASRASYSTIISSVEHTYLGDYASEYRYEAELVAAPQTKNTTTADTTSATDDESAEAVSDYDILLFDADKRLEVSARVAKLQSCSVVSSDGKVIRAKLTAAAIREIASWIEVRWIERYVMPTLNNNVAVQAPRMNVESVWPNGGTGLGLTGKGQVVAVADTGLDTGNMSTLHDDVKGRVVKAYALGRSNDWSDLNGHGTHVVGSVLGNGVKSNGSIKGGAYEATLVFQSTQDKDGYLTGIPNDLNTLFGQAYDDGARIHSNSWGAGRQDDGSIGGDARCLGNYSQDSRAIDEFMFNHPDMLILFAAGNDGVDWSPENGIIDVDSIGSQPTAKNCITVGASENYRTTGGYSGYEWSPWYKFGKDCFPKDPIASDYISRSADSSYQGIAAFSSRGPCDDGRIKPDIVAPGTDILSLRSSLGKTKWGNYNSYYQYCGGTSMACPLVAGSATLVRQWLVENRKITNPDGATIKAVLLAGAKSLTPGQYGSDSYREIPASYPNNVEGWGQVDLGNSVQNAKGLLVYNAQVIAHGETQTFTVRATAGSQLNVVMAYTDAPASLSATKQLVNDLDLLVTSPSGTTYYPNSRSSADRVNNVEGVRIPSGSVESGTYTITVKAYNIAQGMSTSFTGGRSNAQRYSLVVNGADKITSYTVTFNANGGTVSQTSRSVSGGSAVGDLPTPTRSNYTFDGWYTAASGGTRIYSTTVVTGNVTYYAHWTPVVTYCMVTFDANGGTVSPSTRSVASGTAVGDLPTPTRSNYTFDGWYTAASGGTRITASTVVTASVTYFAHWTAIPVNYTVTFNPNGGTVSPTSRMVASGSAVGTLPTPTRSGYMFAGWWTSLSGGTKVDSGTIVMGNVTYYAHWTTSPFSFGGDAQWSLQGDGSYRSGTVSDNGTSWMEATVTGAGTVSFKWRVSSEPNWDKLTFAIDGVTKATISGTNTTAWTSMSYAVSGSGTHTLRWTYTKDVSLSYGSDCGWVTDYQWTGSSSYTVTFNPNGGTVSETSRSVSRDAVIGQLPVPTRNGYTFNGWWTASSGGTQITSTTVVTANVTYYAHWISAPFTLGGAANWSQQADGSWKSGTITDSQSTWMETTVSGEGTVSFKWKVSSEYYCDKLSFYVDGQQRDAISGTVDWSQKYVIVTGSGTHTLRWTYSKDGSVSRGDDCGWIKDYQYSDSIDHSMLSDLYPYTPTGWSGPLVLSASSQNATSSTATSFSPNDSIFASFAVANSGAAFENDFQWALYVDEVLRTTGANWGQGLSSNGSSRWTAIAIGPLSVGTHTVKVVYDYTGLVAESDEGNNVVTQSVTVSGTVTRPSNDDFANATAISGAAGSTAGSNINATYQSGEPLTAVNASATNTVWWTWTAPASGSVQFNTVGSEVYDTVMGIYTGTSVSALTRVAANDNCWESGGYYQSSNSFTAVSGTKYHIAVSGGSYRYQGGIQLNWSMPNVSLQTYTVTYKPGSYGTGAQQTDTKVQNVALTLKGAIFTRTDYTQTGWATSDGGAKVYDLSASYTANAAITLYPFWTANAPQPLVSLSEALDNTNLVFTTGGDAEWIGVADESYDGVDSARGGPLGNKRVTWIRTTVVGPGTISFRWKASCRDVDGFYFRYEEYPYTNTMSSVKYGDGWKQQSVTLRGQGSHLLEWKYFKDSIWYQGIDTSEKGDDCVWLDQVVWTPSTFVPTLSSISISGSASVNSGGSATYTCTATMSNGSTKTVTPTWTIDSGSSYASINSSGTLTAYSTTVQRSVTIKARYTEGGVTKTATKTVTINAATPPPTPAPANDRFASATVISGASGSTAGSNVGATIEAGEPMSYGTVWYKWTAPASVTMVTFNSLGSDFDTILGVYTGSSVSALTEVAYNDDAGDGDFTSEVSVNVTPGNTYMIAICGYGGDEGTVRLNWSTASSPTPTPTPTTPFGPGNGSRFSIDEGVEAHVVGVYGLTGSDFVQRNDGFRVFADSRVVDCEKGSGADAYDHYDCVYYSDLDALVWAGWSQYAGYTDEDAYAYDSYFDSGFVDAYTAAQAEGKNVWSYIDDVAFNSSFAATLTGVFSQADRLMPMIVMFGDDYNWYGDVGAIGHAVVCCGYALDTAKPLTDPSCLRGLFIIDPDNDRENSGGRGNAPDTITYCPTIWDSANGQYEIQGIFGATGYVGAYASCYTIRTPEAFAARWSEDSSGGGSVSPGVVNTYTVTFNANGGSGSMAAQTFAPGVAQGLSANTFTRFGYAFAGWATSADGAAVYADGQSIAPSASMTLYATWREIIAGRPDTSFAKAQTVNGALYRGGALVGTVQVKFGKVSKKNTVKVSAKATMLVGGKAKKITAKGVDVDVGSMRAYLPFKEPIGAMAFEMALDGTFTLKNYSYFMAEATIGGALRGGSHGTFRLADFALSVPGELVTALLPYEEAFDVVNGKWKVAKAAGVKVAKDNVAKESGLRYEAEFVIVDDSSGKTNLSALKLNYTAKGCEKFLSP